MYNVVCNGAIPLENGECAFFVVLSRMKSADVQRNSDRREKKL